MRKHNMINGLCLLSIYKFILIISLYMGIGMPYVFAQASEPPYWQDIQNFKKQDQNNPPAKNSILFVGSSSFTKWADIDTYFPKEKIINRGFGGSTFLDLMRYADDVIYPYHPKQVVIYEGDNDAAYSDQVSASEIFNRFKELYSEIRAHLPKVTITYISIKPSPSREKFFPVMRFANWKIQQFIKRQKNASFIDVWHLMLDDYGQPVKELFGPDMLHMNAKGYGLWQKAIEPYLIR